MRSDTSLLITPEGMLDTQSEESLSEQLDRFSEGDQAAGFEVYERYQKRLVELANRKMGPQLRAKVQPESIAATVFRSVIMGLADGKYKLPKNGSLWSLMAFLTNRKILKRVDHLKTIKRGGKAKVHNDAECPLDELVMENPTPAEIAAFADQLQMIRSRLKPESFAILELLMDGYRIRDIAEIQEVSSWTIRRRIKGIKDKLRGLLGEEGDVPGWEEDSNAGDGESDLAK